MYPGCRMVSTNVSAGCCLAAHEHADRLPNYLPGRSAALQPSLGSLPCWGMAQVIQIDRTIFEQAPNLASVPETVSAPPVPVAGMQPVARSLPAWYLTPVVLVPIAAATFIIGNLLLMIPWQAL